MPTKDQSGYLDAKDGPMTQEEIENQIRGLRSEMREKADNGSKFWTKVLAPVAIVFVGAVFAYGTLTNKVEQNTADIAEIKTTVKESRAIAQQTSKTLAVIQSQQEKQIELVSRMTRTFEEVRNSQAQYAGDIASKLAETSRLLNSAAERLSHAQDND